MIRKNYLPLYVVKETVKMLFIFLPVTILGIFLVPIGLLLLKKKPNPNTERLPKWLNWFNNYNRLGYPIGTINNIYTATWDIPPKQFNDGISGDLGYQSKWKNPHGFIARYNWLALRNPCNEFQYTVLGINFRDYEHMGGWLKIDGANSKYIRHTFRHKKTGKLINELYLSYKYPFINYMFRLRIGYKLGDAIREHRFHNGQVQWVYSLTPFKKIS